MGDLQYDKRLYLSDFKKGAVLNLIVGWDIC